MVYLSSEQVKKLLVASKIPFQKYELAKKKDDAARIAGKIGYPVVLKIVSPDIIHKSDVGGVQSGLKDKEEVIKGFDSIIRNVKKKKPKARIDGILVQQMAQGHELIIGVKKDPQFGHAIMFGLGGVLVEIFKDVSFRITPVNKKEAVEMIKEIRSFPVLAGARGMKPADIDAIADIIVRTSLLVEKNPRIMELDFNPVIAGPVKAVVVDARIMVE